MRRHAVFSVLVHGLGADLDFYRLATRVAHDGVQRTVAIGLGPGDVVVKLFGHQHKAAVHPTQSGVAVGDACHHHPQGPDVVDLLKPQGFAAHFAHDAVDVFGPALHCGCHTLGLQAGLQLFAQSLHLGFALGALLVEQPGHAAVGVGLQKTKSQVFQLPLDLPDAQAVGQWCKNLQRFSRQPTRQGQLGLCKVAQRLQARGQAQHHHPQIAREGQQHLAYVLGLRHRDRRAAGAGGLGLPGLTLQAHQPGGLQRQRGKVVAKGLGDHLLRLVQVLAGIHQVTGRLHRLRTTDLAQDGGHRIRMGQRVLTGVKCLARQQRLGKGPRTQQRLSLIGQALGGGLQHRRGSVGAMRLERQAFHQLKVSRPGRLSPAKNQPLLAPDRWQPGSGHGQHRQTPADVPAARAGSLPAR